jgi:hypothetical protein
MITSCRTGTHHSVAGSYMVDKYRENGACELARYVGPTHFSGRVQNHAGATSIKIPKRSMDAPSIEWAVGVR